MKLDPGSLIVDSFNPGQDAPSSLNPEEPPDGEVGSRYCTLVGTCTTCWWTRCNCA